MAELRMPGLEQVLSDDGKFELSGRPPSQMQGRRTVAVYQLGWQSAYIAVGLITLKSFGQIESGLQGYLIVRT